MQKACGGVGDVKKADAKIQGIVDNLRAQVSQKCGKNFQKLTAINYKSQIVAGTNYFIKVNADGASHLHLRVYVPLPMNGNEPELHSVQANKSLNDPIEHF